MRNVARWRLMLAGMALAAVAGSATAADSLIVTASISGLPSGSYGTRYVVVMWMENAANAFQRTFRMAGNETNANDLPIWNSKNGGSQTVDGLTSATPNGNATIRGAWNLKGSNGSRVPDGTYKFNIEVSNRHTSTSNYLGYFVQGSIAVGSSAATKNGVDSSLHSGSTYITNVSAVFTPALSTAITPINAAKAAGAPLSFAVPPGFSGAAVLRLFEPSGRLVWQKGVMTSPGSDLVLNDKDLRSAAKSRGMGVLEAQFGSARISRPYLVRE